MKRYDIPRLAFINKLDRAGANPTRVLRDLREKLRLNAAFVQLPIGLEETYAGLVDVIGGRSCVRARARAAKYSFPPFGPPHSACAIPYARYAFPGLGGAVFGICKPACTRRYRFEGPSGEKVVEGDVPPDMVEATERARATLVERLSDHDSVIGDMFLEDQVPSAEELRAAVRRTTVARTFVPVFMGSAFKNKGVQKLLDGVVDYLPCPTEVVNTALDRAAGEARVQLECDDSKPLVALAFKLEESRYGQLTCVRAIRVVGFPVWAPIGTCGTRVRVTWPAAGTCACTRASSCAATTSRTSTATARK